jgi:hypothetical protein
MTLRFVLPIGGGRRRRRRPALRSIGACVAACLLAYGYVPTALAQTATATTVTVDATAAGTPLKPIWAYHGYD